MPGNPLSERRSSASIQWAMVETEAASARWDLVTPMFETVISLRKKSRSAGRWKPIRTGIGARSGTW